MPVLIGTEHTFLVSVFTGLPTLVIQSYAQRRILLYYGRQFYYGNRVELPYSLMQVSGGEYLIFGGIYADVSDNPNKGSVRRIICCYTALSFCLECL